MIAAKPRSVIATFYADSHGRLTMDSLEVLSSDGGVSYYDVDWSRTMDAYLYHMSGSGGRLADVEVRGIYAISGESIAVTEIPSNLADDRARERNKTRRLRRPPGRFNLYGEEADLFDWLQNHGIYCDAVWCEACRDWLPGDSLCEHAWWCDITGAYSTPDERCECATRKECRD